MLQNQFSALRIGDAVLYTVDGSHGTVESVLPGHTGVRILWQDGTSTYHDATDPNHEHKRIVPTKRAR